MGSSLKIMSYGNGLWVIVSVKYTIYICINYYYNLKTIKTIVMLYNIK